MSQNYREPVYEGFPLPKQVVYKSLNEAWRAQAKRTQEEMRYDVEVKRGVEVTRMNGIWSRLLRKWASKHAENT